MDDPRCRCGRALPEGVCLYCDVVDGVGVDPRGGYGSEPDGTLAARVMARPSVARRRTKASLRTLNASAQLKRAA